jgi:hypothetical protein
MVLAVAIPTVALLSPRPARFGWQMYSVAHPAPRAWLQASDGSTTEYDLAGKLAVLRADVPDGASVGRQLCVLGKSAAALVELRPNQLVRVACD